MKWVEFSDAQAQAMGLAEQVAADLRLVLERQDTATLCVPGGSTPKRFFGCLSEQVLDWSRVKVVLNDERWVPRFETSSNEALLQQSLLINQASAAQLVSLYREGVTLETGQTHVNEAIQSTLPIDVCVLGMGEDGHTASLFPGMPGIDQALAQDAQPGVVCALGSAEPRDRISFNLSALLTAGSHYLLVIGQTKRQVIESAVEGTLDVPIGQVLALAARPEVYYAS